ncbi:MAG: VRR-NUC domain-containing protein [Culicoidibacterales bacterium]
MANKYMPRAKPAFGNRKSKSVKVAPNGQIYTDESDIQIQCVKEFKLRFPKYADDLFAIPNGAKVGGKVNKKGFPIGAKRLKDEGMLSGAADLQFAVPFGDFHGLFIEMKTPINDLSPAQRKFLKRRAELDYAVEVCKSTEQFMSVIMSYMQGNFIQLPVWELRVNRQKEAEKLK